MQPQNFPQCSFLPCTGHDVCLAFGTNTGHAHHAQDSECGSVRLSLQVHRPREAKVKFFPVHEDPGERHSRACGHKGDRQHCLPVVLSILFE